MQPDFDPGNFGYAKLTPLIRSFVFEIDQRDSGQNNINVSISGTADNPFYRIKTGNSSAAIKKLIKSN